MKKGILQATGRQLWARSFLQPAESDTRVFPWILLREEDPAVPLLQHILPDDPRAGNSGETGASLVLDYGVLK